MSNVVKTSKHCEYAKGKIYVLVKCKGNSVILFKEYT